MELLKEKEKKSPFLDGVYFLIIAILAFVFSLQASNDIWIKGNKGADSSVFQYVARVMQAGGMPYRDTFDHKGPLLYIINFAGAEIAEWRGIWIFELIAIFFTFFFIFKIARIYTGRRVSLAICLISTSLLFSFFDAGNLTEEYAMPFIAASLYIFIDYFDNSHISIPRLFGCGFSFASILMLRPNMCATWLVLCIGVLIVCIRTKKFKDLGHFIVWFVLGAAMLLLPILVWLAINGALKAFWEDYILFNLNYSSNEVRASLTNRMNALSFFLNRGLVWFSIAGLCLLPKKYFLDILYLAYMGVSLALIIISGRSYNHYGMVIVPMLAYPLARSYGILKETSNGHILSNFFILYLSITFAVSPWMGGVQNAVSEYDRRGTYFGTRELETVDLIQGCSTEDDRIIVMGNYDIIYNLSNRFAASRFSYQMPPLTIDEERAKEFYREIEENKPKVIVIKENVFAYDWMLEYIEKNNYYEVGKTTDNAITVYSRDD